MGMALSTDSKPSWPVDLEGRYVTAVAPAGTALHDVYVVPSPSGVDLPTDAAFPVGAIGFRVTGVGAGTAVSVTLFLPADVVADAYYKYGPTSENPAMHWYVFNYDGTTGAEMLADRIVLHLVDGGPGDGDLLINTELIDPGAPALVSAAVGGMVWLDVSQDGAQQPEETQGIPNALVQVFDPYRAKLAQAGTDSGGRYLIRGIEPGRYVVAVEGLPGYFPSTTEERTIVVTAGEYAEGVDFGLVRLPAVTLQTLVACWEAGRPVLRWCTLFEEEGVGFHVWRGVDPAGPFKRVTVTAVPSTAAGDGGCHWWVDEVAEQGVDYWYQVETIPDGQMYGPVPLQSSRSRVFLPIIKQ